MRSLLKFAAQMAVAVMFFPAIAQTPTDLAGAVAFDDARAVARLLAQGADPNAPDDKGQPPLVLALRDQQYAAAEALLKAPGLKVDAANANGETAVMMAALRGNLAWVQRLLAQGAAINRAGWTPLHYAASGPEAKVIALLLERGAAIDAVSPTGHTPLMMAAGYGTIDGATLLLARGADPRPRHPNGRDAAEFARRAGHEQLADQLQQAAAARR
jgi:ankyrin repeat protein